jgi:hypothetical protein
MIIQLVALAFINIISHLPFLDKTNEKPLFARNPGVSKKTPFLNKFDYFWHFGEKSEAPPFMVCLTSPGTYFSIDFRRRWQLNVLKQLGINTLSAWRHSNLKYGHQWLRYVCLRGI